jgi:hypothetical protein
LEKCENFYHTITINDQTEKEPKRKTNYKRNKESIMVKHLPRITKALVSSPKITKNKNKKDEK